MELVTSISGGMSSATIAAKTLKNDLVFALVRSEDKEIIFKDRYLAQQVSDRIGKEFIGTVEDDTIIYTIMDLEQYLGKAISWVSGVTFEQLILNSGGYLPNVMKRFCTSELKMRPIFHWWYEKYKAQPVEMAIGYRVNEKGRVDKERAKLNKNGLSEFKATFEKHPSGRNKWVTLPWRKPIFPLYDWGMDKQDITKFWRGKNVRFADYNNCIGCFHRKAAFLKKMQQKHPKKFNWFIKMESQNKGFFKKDIAYQKIKDLNFTLELDFEAGGCDSGFCGF